MATATSDVPQDGPRSHATEKIIMVTGGTSGIGKATFEALIAHNPTHVYMLCRNLKEGMAIIDQMQKVAPNVLMNFLPCDLSSFASIRSAVGAFSLLTSHLDILICNAGVFMVPPGLTDDGYEKHFGINHLGHALLIKLLLPTLLRTAALPSGDVRIIIISSQAHKWAPSDGIDFTALQTKQAKLSSRERYGQSKLANLLYAKEMAKRYPAIKTVSLHPGYVDTNNIYHLKKKYLRSDRLIRRVFGVLNTVYRGVGGQLLTPEEGARIPIWCASASADDLTNGEYYDEIGVPGKCSELAKDRTLAADLWAWTQSIVAVIPFDENSTRE